MSFLSILKTIASTALGVEHVVAPVAKIVLPQFAGVISEVDAMTTRLQLAISTSEATFTAPSSGPQKLAAVVEDFQAGIAAAQDILSATGHVITYDQTLVQPTIDAFVKAYNNMALLKASIKVNAPVA